MIGNDVIDLTVARKESNWERPRFLQKIFTNEEQQFIQHSTNKETAVWLLWSRKESAYKILVRLLQRRFYAPKKIENTNLFSSNSSLKQGQVNYDGYFFTTASEITNTHIHTIAQLTNEAPTTINYQWFSIKKADYQTQHDTTRKQLLNRYAALTNHSKDHLTIKKDTNSIPSIYHNQTKQSTFISMAHHGHFGGFAILDPHLSNNSIKN